MKPTVGQQLAAARRVRDAVQRLDAMKAAAWDIGVMLESIPIGGNPLFSFSLANGDFIHPVSIEDMERRVAMYSSTEDAG